MDSRIKKLFDTEYSKIYGNNILIDFSKEWHKYVVNFDELGAEIVDLSSEGIPLPYPGHPGKALKIKVGAGETKYINYPSNTGSLFWSKCDVYLTGTVTANMDGTGLSPVCNLTNSWKTLGSMCRYRGRGVITISGNSSGGYAYITNIMVYDHSEYYTAKYYSSCPNQQLDGSTTYTYIILPEILNNKGQVWLYCRIAGDGTNPCNVNVYINTPDGYKLIASVSNTNSTVSNYFIGCFPIKIGGHDLSYYVIKYEVSGYGTFESFVVITQPLRHPDFYSTYLSGLKTSSASNTSTTVSTYTLIDNNGKGNRYKQASVSLSSPSGGTAKLYINGQLVADFSGTSGTFTIPDDIDIWKITVDLAGDGTTAATADFKGLELLGPYIAGR